MKRFQEYSCGCQGHWILVTPRTTQRSSPQLKKKTQMRWVKTMAISKRGKCMKTLPFMKGLLPTIVSK